jgi:hypothetical protein
MKMYWEVLNAEKKLYTGKAVKYIIDKQSKKRIIRVMDDFTSKMSTQGASRKTPLKNTIFVMVKFHVPLKSKKGSLV